MKAIVWSQPQCAFCEQAKKLLERSGIEYEERKVGVKYTREDLQAAVPGARSVPQIFLDEQYIGGFQELKTHMQQLKTANAS